MSGFKHRAIEVAGRAGSAVSDRASARLSERRDRMQREAEWGRDHLWRYRAIYLGSTQSIPDSTPGRRCWLDAKRSLGLQLIWKLKMRRFEPLMVQPVAFRFPWEQVSSIRTEDRTTFEKRETATRLALYGLDYGLAFPKEEKNSRALLTILGTDSEALFAVEAEFEQLTGLVLSTKSLWAAEPPLANRDSA